MVRGRKRARTSENMKENEEETLSGGSEGTLGYEQFRDQRIKENMQRMQTLGILDLSLKLKSEVVPSKRSYKRKISDEKALNLPPLAPSEPARRSSRLKSVTPVSYVEKRTHTHKKETWNGEIRIGEGSKPEIYTEEHDKLLGDCKTTWALYVDGCDRNGKRIYDPELGETCHQCRQKTLGLHTHCIKCSLVQGQFCGDCLYMRYGENVIEANQNSNWICPVCRGICNCSLCRKAKGWAPTGAVYRKVSKLGFKSVAHYLIETHRTQPISEDPDSKISNPSNEPAPFAGTGSLSLDNELLEEDEGPDGSSTPPPPPHDDTDDRMEEEEGHIFENEHFSKFPKPQLKDEIDHGMEEEEKVHEREVEHVVTSGGCNEYDDELKNEKKSAAVPNLLLKI